MDVEGQVPVLNVSDLRESIAWFERLGWRRLWEYGDPPDFGAVGNGGAEIFLCRDGQGCRADLHPQGGAWMSWFVGSRAEVDRIHEEAEREGIEIAMPPTDEPWGMRELHLQHPDGHIFRVGAGPEEGEQAEVALRSQGPPLPIERVDVPVRLERRLAALLADLARHKGMSVDSCLEEILLHTSEQVGGGVASPHTRRTLAHIRELKRTHGIDYDVHASYRFVER